jgi:selenocysteine lyase/cysteine desulfurase
VPIEVGQARAPCDRATSMLSDATPSLAPGDFSPSGVYLDTAAIGLPPRCVSQALHGIIERWSRGEIRAAEFDAVVASARAAFARLLGVRADCVAIASAASSLVGVVAGSLPRGAEVLCADGDFTSLLFPFLERQAAGELRVRSCPLNAIAESIGTSTALVAVSAVQSSNGDLCDLAGLERACKRTGTRSLLDATQAVGWLPLDGNRFDYVLASGYKWLLSPRGTTFMSINPEQLGALRPHSAGWYAGENVWDSIYGAPLRLASSARRFDVSPAWFMWLGCAEALAFIERIGVSAIYEHNRQLSTAFLERLDRPASGSAIVSISGDSVFEALAGAGIAASRRGGATRLSFHLYNTLSQAIAAADVVRGALR